MPDVMHEKYKELKNKYKLDDLGDDDKKESSSDKRYRQALMKSLLWLERDGYSMLFYG